MSTVYIVHVYEISEDYSYQTVKTTVEILSCIASSEEIALKWAELQYKENYYIRFDIIECKPQSVDEYHIKCLIEEEKESLRLGRLKQRDKELADLDKQKEEILAKYKYLG